MEDQSKSQEKLSLSSEAHRIKLYYSQLYTFEYENDVLHLFEIVLHLHFRDVALSGNIYDIFTNGDIFFNM